MKTSRGRCREGCTVRSGSTRLFDARCAADSAAHPFDVALNAISSLRAQMSLRSIPSFGLSGPPFVSSDILPISIIMACFLAVWFTKNAIVIPRRRRETSRSRALPSTPSRSFTSALTSVLHNQNRDSKRGGGLVVVGCAEIIDEIRHLRCARLVEDSNERRSMPVRDKASKPKTWKSGELEYEARLLRRREISRSRGCGTAHGLSP